jgi:DHA1 family tetracycline resistance protein-like MFS transporter
MSKAPKAPPLPVPTSKQPARSAIAVVYLAVFLDLLGFGIILPLLPYYALRFGAAGAWVGALFTAYSLAQLLGSSLLGRLSDRFGRRPVLLLALFGSTVSFIASGLADSLYTLLLARAVAGLFGGSIATAQAYVADVTAPEERARYMGGVGASIGMGFVIGPFVGSQLSRFGFHVAAFAAAGLCALDLILAALFLKESRSPDAAQRERVSLREALSDSTVARLLVVGLLTMLAFVGMESTFALLGKMRFGLGAEQLGWVFAGIGITMALVQQGLLGRLSRWLGEDRVALCGALLIGVGMLALPWAPKLALAVGILSLLAVGQGLLSPSLSTLLSRRAPPDLQGGVLGVSQSVAAAGRAVGPLLAGALFDRDIHLPYTMGAVLALAASALLFVRSPSTAPETPMLGNAE